MNIALEIVIALVSLPFHAWCHLRHRKDWQVNAPGWGWECPRDGFNHSFSHTDVNRLTAHYKKQGEEAARRLLADDGVVEQLLGAHRDE